MKRNFFIPGVGILIILTSFLVFTACDQPESGEPTETIEVTGIPPTITNSQASFKIFTQISKGMDTSEGYVAKGEKLINGATTVRMDLYDPDGQPWKGEGPFNVAVVISPAVVTNADDVIVHVAQPSFSSQVHSLSWNGMMELKNNPIIARVSGDPDQQIQDVFEGIVCASEETDVSHPVHWISTDGKAGFLLALNGKMFSLNLAERFELKKLFLITGAWATDARENGPHTLQNPTTSNATYKDDVAGLNTKTVSFTYSATELVLSSDNPTVEKFFKGTYKKK
jgi:hypothetical protein